MLASSLVPLPIYHKAQQVRNLIRKQILEAFFSFDVLLCPASASPPPPIGEAKDIILTKEEVIRTLFQQRTYSTPFVLAPTPAASIPCGFTQEGLPLGMQLVASPFNETAIFRIAYAYQQNTEWSQRRPLLP